MGNLLLAPLIESIKSDGFHVAGHVISYFSASENMFVFVGCDPIPEQSTMQIFELDTNNPLQIKLRPASSPTLPKKDKKLIAPVDARQDERLERIGQKRTEKLKDKQLI